MRNIESMYRKVRKEINEDEIGVLPYVYFALAIALAYLGDDIQYSEYEFDTIHFTDAITDGSSAVHGAAFMSLFNAIFLFIRRGFFRVKKDVK